MTFKTHNEILHSGAIDSIANYAGEIIPDNWLNVYGQHRDSDCLQRSNFKCFLAALGGENEENGVRVDRFGHWAVGWIEEIFVDKNHPEKIAIAEKIIAALENYPVIDENDLSNMEYEEAQETWKNCYSIPERIKYIRENRSQFEFRDYKEIISNVRGETFSGYANELID
jgi:hypothetical protein